MTAIQDQPIDPTASDVRTVIATFPTYGQAETAVDRLSDAGFPVAGVGIVGHDVRTVEVVTGRVTKGRAALNGLLGGVWTGLLIGLLLGLFVPGIFWVGLILTALAFGAVWGAVIGFVGHAMTGGRRDFDSLRSLEAARYDVVVDAARADEATRALTTDRAAA